MEAAAAEKLRSLVCQHKYGGGGGGGEYGRLLAWLAASEALRAAGADDAQRERMACAAAEGELTVERLLRAERDDVAALGLAPGLRILLWQAVCEARAAGGGGATAAVAGAAAGDASHQ